MRSLILVSFDGLEAAMRHHSLSVHVDTWEASSDAKRAGVGSNARPSAVIRPDALCLEGGVAGWGQVPRFHMKLSG